MALLADSAEDRVAQLLVVTERLTQLVGEETRRIEAREPPLSGPEAEEKNRLVNAYRLELTRIGQDRALIDGAPPALLTQLRARTATLHEELAHHELALGAVKLIAEGLVQAIAEESTRQRGGATGYGAQGRLEPPVSPQPALLDRSA